MLQKKIKIISYRKNYFLYEVQAIAYSEEPTEFRVYDIFEKYFNTYS